MKNTLRKFGRAAVAGAALSLAGLATASADTTTTTTYYSGTVSTLGPDAIVVNSDSAPPMRYSSSRTTTYVDENGNPVAVETVKTGSPVTVYYDRNGDVMTATKVVVRRAGPGDTIEHKKTTTTTVSPAP
jgi:hypothetical protein